MAAKEYYQHPNSPLRSRANFVAHLTQVSEEIEYTEQVWLETEGASTPMRAILLSAPFFVYGYSLLDTVELDKSGNITRTLESSGRSLLRVFFTDLAKARQIAEQLQTLGAEHLEWMNSKYVCVDLPTKEAVDSCWSLLAELEESGDLEFEVAILNPAHKS